MTSYREVGENRRSDGILAVAVAEAQDGMRGNGWSGAARIRGKH